MNKELIKINKYYLTNFIKEIVKERLEKNNKLFVEELRRLRKRIIVLENKILVGKIKNINANKK